MENKTNTLGGFEAIFDSFIPKTEEELNLEETKETLENLDIDDETGEKIEDPVIAKMKKEKKVTTKETEEEEEEKIEEEEETKPVKTTKKEKDEDTVDNSFEEDNEASIVEGFFGAMAEKLGWDIDDEEETPKDVDSLIAYFQNIIEKESTPVYANDEVEALDNFVKQGGNLRDYLSIGAEIDLDNVDLDDERTQKMIVKELLQQKGFSATRIDKMIAKYEDAGILEDEAEDAIEDLKELRQQQKEQLLANQKKQFEAYKAQQQQFYTNVVDEIKGLKNIRGIAIPEKDKKVLIDYIFKPDTDGKTKYQKDYAKGGVKNLIESAYFTMNADKLIEAAKKEGNNSAIDRFKNSLKNNQIGTKSKQAPRGSSNDTIWDSFTRKLRIS